LEDKVNQTIKLKDGRTLGYAEYGRTDGKPLFDFHGNPSSRLESKLYDEAAQQMGIRVIGVDRPGMGLSDYKPKRKLLDWPDDVIELADGLGIQRFSIIGDSGGGSAVLACAYKIPERLDSVTVLCCPRPLGARGSTSGWIWPMRFQAFLGRHGTLWINDLAMKGFFSMMKNNTEKTLSRMSQQLTGADKEIFNQDRVRKVFTDCIREAFRSGSRGVVLDFVLSMKPWGFRLENIQIEINLWQGEKDTAIPVAMGRYLAEVIPHCQARFLPDEGHFSLLPNHIEEILGSLNKV
jgi:pimeloyl-ACP methyl ester carboxylesterase